MATEISALEKFSVKYALDRYITTDDKNTDEARELKAELRKNGDVLRLLKDECLHPNFAKDTSSVTIGAFKNRAVQRLKAIASLEREGVAFCGFVPGKRIQLLSRNAMLGKAKSLNKEILHMRARMASMEFN